MKSNLFIPKNIVRGGFRKYMEGEVVVPAFRLRGHFHVELVSRAGIIKQSLDFYNLITNAGLDNYYTSGFDPNSWYAGVGTGTAAPAATDTTLQAEITPAISNRTTANGGVSTADSYIAGSPDMVQRQRTFLFDFGQSNGTLTEIGLFTASSGGTMCVRQLFKDGTGTPTAVVKTSSDQLRVTYTVQAIPPQGDVVGAPVNISGTDYTFTTRAANMGSSTWYTNFWATSVTGSLNGGNYEAFDNVMGTRTGSPTGTGSQFPSAHSLVGYTNGNYYGDVNATWGTGTGNFAGGIKSFGFYCSSGRFMQMGPSPALPKTNVKSLALVFRWAWGRYP